MDMERSPHDLPARVTALEVQVERIVSDIESEKSTRARSTKSLFDLMNELDEKQEMRLDRLSEKQEEKYEELRGTVLKMVGAVLAFQFIIATGIAIWAVVHK
jgi:acyl-CoA hydrolase